MGTKPDLSYLDEDLRPQVLDYLEQMKSLANRAWHEGNAAAALMARRCYDTAMGAIRAHRWPL